jgi:hypothetical protein
VINRNLFPAILKTVTVLPLFTVTFDEAAPRMWITLAEAAAKLQVHPCRARKLIEGGVLPARQVVPNAPWLIKPQDLDSIAVQDSLRRCTNKNKQEDNNQSKMSFL